MNRLLKDDGIVEKSIEWIVRKQKRTECKMREYIVEKREHDFRKEENWVFEREKIGLQKQKVINCKKETLINCRMN